MSQHVHPEKDRAEIASEEGFTGTFAGFIAWLEESLVYGGIKVHEPAPDRWGRMHTKVETVTGGFSSDERLLGRVNRSLLPQSAWESSHRGGGVVYSFPDWMTNGDEQVWVEPDHGIFDTIGRARTVRLVNQHGDYIEFAYDGPLELVYREPDRDITVPNAVLIVRPISEENPLFG